MRQIWRILLMVICSAGIAEAGSPFDVGDRAQLFVDKMLVRSVENVAFTLHPAGHIAGA